FADLVNGGSKKGEEGNYDRTKVKVGEQTNYTQKNNSYSEKQWGGRCIDIEESEINVEVMGRSVVGEVKALCFLAKLPVLCEEQGLGKVEVKILGSLEVLVVMENESTAKNILKDQEHGMKRWLHKIRKGGSYHRKAGRITWINILGLPMSCWKESMFKKIASAHVL
ncbi:hypothetical protein Tco_0468502, partial [Tanacetum coccineum]